jgi:hypothetical protein
MGSTARWSIMSHSPTLPELPDALVQARSTAMSKSFRYRSTYACLSILLLLPVGCQPASKPAKSVVAAEETASKPAKQTLSPQEQAASQELSANLSQIINECQLKYWPLRYEYAEDLLERLDQIEGSLAGKTESKATRFFPKLAEGEEKAHLRETARRWQAKSGKKFRAEIDRLKASVAARKPGERFHPQFQKDFSRTFDDFIKIEVLEIRERRNQQIHEAAEKLFGKYREIYPQLVDQFEAELSKPEYALPVKAP